MAARASGPSCSDVRVAILPHPGGEPSLGLVTDLRALGHDARIVGAAAPTLADRVLERRGFVPSLSSLPRAVWALSRERFDVVCACSPVAAAAALALPAEVRPALVLAIGRPPERATLAARRLELPLLSSALDRCDALVVPDEPTAAAVRRWLAREPLVVSGATALADLLGSLSK